MRIVLQNAQPNPKIVAISDMPKLSVGQLVAITHEEGRLQRFDYDNSESLKEYDPWFRLINGGQSLSYLNEGWDTESLASAGGYVLDAKVRLLMPGERLVIENAPPDFIDIDGKRYRTLDVARCNLTVASGSLDEIRENHPNMPKGISTHAQAVEYLLSISTSEHLLDDCKNSDGEYILRGWCPLAK